MSRFHFSLSHSDLPALHAEDEGDGVHQVGLSAAVGADDGGEVSERTNHLTRRAGMDDMQGRGWQKWKSLFYVMVYATPAPSQASFLPSPSIASPEMAHLRPRITFEVLQRHSLKPPHPRNALSSVKKGWMEEERRDASRLCSRGKRSNMGGKQGGKRQAQENGN